jgi:ATP-binding cassette subfamily B multidrug efflux pump
MLVTLIRRYSRPYLPYILAVIAFQLASTIAALYLPSLNAQIIDEGVSRGDTDFIWRTGAVMLLVAFVQVGTAIAGVYFGSKTAMALGRDLRRGVFRKVTSFSAKDVNAFGAPTLITRGTNDVPAGPDAGADGPELHGVHADHVHRRHHHGPARGHQPVLAGLGLGPHSSLWWSATSWCASCPCFRSMQTKIDRINEVLREQIIGIRVVRAFVREPYETERFGQANKELTDVSLKIGALFVLMFPAIGMILHLSTAAVLWFGGQRVDAGDMQVGSLTAFLQYLLQILMAVMMGTFMAMMIPRRVRLRRPHRRGARRRTVNP